MRLWRERSATHEVHVRKTGDIKLSGNRDREEAASLFLSFFYLTSKLSSQER